MRRFFFVKRERSHFLLDVPVLALLSPQLHGDVLRHTCVPPEPLPRNRRLSAAQHGPSSRSVHSAAQHCTGPYRRTACALGTEAAWMPQCAVRVECGLGCSGGLQHVLSARIP